MNTRKPKEEDTTSTTEPETGSDAKETGASSLTGATSGGLTERLETSELIIKISQAIPKLTKEEYNEHSEYNYVPIDDYYDRVATVAHQHGLTWTIREVEFKQIAESTPGKPIFAFVYAVDVHNAMMLITEKDWAQHTIIMQMQGAQTTGAAASYAEKIFMRTTFKVVTGEKDADHLAPIEFGEKK